MHLFLFATFKIGKSKENIRDKFKVIKGSALKIQSGKQQRIINIKNDKMIN